MSALADHLPVLGSAAACAAGAAALVVGRGGTHDAPAADRRRVAGVLLAAGALLGAAGAVRMAGTTPTGSRAAAVSSAVVTAACCLVLPAAVAALPLHPVRDTDATADRGFVAALLGCGALTATGVVTGSALGAVGGWGLVLALAALLWWRTERSSEVERARWLWVAAGLVAPALVAGQVLFALDGPSDAPLGTTADGGWDAVAAVTLPLSGATALAAVVIGLRAPLLVDVRHLIARLAGYAVSTEVALALFALGQVLVQVSTGSAPGKSGYALLAVGVAATFHPVSLLVRWLFDELLFGGRRDPVAVMSNLGVQLRTESDPAAWVASLRADLGASRVELWDAVELLATSDDGGAGERAQGTPVRVPLAVGGHPVGALVVVVDLPDEQAAGQLRRLLDLLAPPLARTMHGLALTQQLAVERSRALAALEEERRRLRRDLHDGLGPVLTGIAYSADAARNFVRTDPVRAEGLLADLREDVAGSIAEVRRLVVGLRPPALDERGLVGAVRQQVARLGAAHTTALQVRVDGEGLPDALPAAVEVAAYRVAVEAVTNAARHALPRADGSGRPGRELRVAVRFALEGDALVVTVEDDGAPAPAWVAGVGTASMRERCEQLHGSLTTGPTDGGGLVRAVLPLTPTSTDER